MRIPRIHVDAPLAAGAELALPDGAFQHVVRVLRMEAGAALLLFNGDGAQYRAELVAVEKRAARARVVAVEQRELESPLRLVLAQGVSRGERMDYTLQKAVELGVDAIVPLVTERSVVQLGGDRAARRLQHWQGVVIGACEQSGRNRVPLVQPLQPLRAWLDGRAEQPGAGLVLDPQAVQGLAQMGRPEGALTLLVGPEGGLSEAELAAARDAGFAGLRLGPRVLRTETAGVAALAALQVLWGDLG